MKTTKHNICEIIEKYLKDQNIKYIIHNNNSKGSLYELFVSSFSSYIQIEYNMDDENDDLVYAQLYTKPDDNYESIYDDIYTNNIDNDSIESLIESLIESTRKIAKGISKIESKIEQIKEICDEYGLVFEEFIEVLYNFD